MLQISRLGMVALDSVFQGCYSGFRTRKNVCTLRRIDSRICSVGGHNRRWSVHPITTKTDDEEGKFSGIPSNSPQIVEEAVASNKLNISRTKGQAKDIQEFHYSDIQVKVAENEDLVRLVTIIVMDIETTGFSKKSERIIEIALRDLKGGPNSTFQTLVNPQRQITNSHIHGITNDMTDDPSVPRMEDVIPILLQYIRSRQQPGGYVVLIAHNGRTFDFPFLKKEFDRCSYKFPSNWRFFDTLPLAREARGSKESASLESLREHYNVRPVGSAHRAMTDVHSLASIFQKITFDLKLPMSELLQRCFTESDLGSSSKKKKK